MCVYVHLIVYANMSISWGGDILSALILLFSLNGTRLINSEGLGAAQLYYGSLCLNVNVENEWQLIKKEH